MTGSWRGSRTEQNSGAHPVAPRAERSGRNNGDERLRELIVCSLEPWDEVWRRNQFFTDLLLRQNPALRVLFVEPAADPLFDLSCGRVPGIPRLRTISFDGRLRAFRPLKPLPRKAGPLADRLVVAQVVAAARFLGFSRPTLWVNDVTFAPLIAKSGWRALYDVTDDWLLAPFSARELERLRRLDALALATADEVVVCSLALAESRGLRRSVSLIRNGVDVEHLRQPRARPRDLPNSPVAVYVGSLHAARLDVELVVELGVTLPAINFVLVGPNSLDPESLRRVTACPNITLLGPRPYSDVPGYLQHADVVIVPHLVSPFTESLDPIKTYECLAIDTPTVATPVAGFRDYAAAINVVERGSFVARVGEVLSEPVCAARTTEPVDWRERALVFESALNAAAGGGQDDDASNARRL